MGRLDRHVPYAEICGATATFKTRGKSGSNIGTAGPILHESMGDAANCCFMSQQIVLRLAHVCHLWRFKMNREDKEIHGHLKVRRENKDNEKGVGKAVKK